MAPPVIVLGVGRSGTTLLRVMLDLSSELAIPYETFFVPQLAHRHGSRPNIAKFLDDLGRLRTLYDWGIKPDDVRPRLEEGMATREAIAAIFETYAERQGKPRWGRTNNCSCSRRAPRPTPAPATSRRRNARPKS